MLFFNFQASLLKMYTFEVTIYFLAYYLSSPDFSLLAHVNKTHVVDKHFSPLQPLRSEKVSFSCIREKYCEGNKFLHYSSWKNGFKQVKATSEKNCFKSVSSTPFLRTQTPAMRSLCRSNYFFGFCIAICDVRKWIWFA